MPSRAVLLAACLLLPAGVSAQRTPSSGLYGELADGYYTAPGQVYRVPVPVLPELGGQIQDTENVVTFDDDLTTHVSIACFPLDPGQLWELDEQGRRDYLAGFYRNYVLADFARRFPGATTERTYSIPDFHDGAIFSISLLPGGSFFQGRRPALLPEEPPRPTIAKRGSLLFVRGRYIFVVSAELSERVTQGAAYGKTAEEENEVLLGRVLTFARRLSFPTPLPAKSD